MTRRGGLSYFATFLKVSQVLDAWLTRHEREVTESLLRFAYVLDVDSTVKTVYGRQEGAEPGCNSHKPGRPSYNYHTFFVGTVRHAVAEKFSGRPAEELPAQASEG